jgi:hypothetical protein
MRITQSSTFLRRVLMADAATSGAMGLLLLAAGGILERQLGGPAWLLNLSAVVLLPFAGLLIYLATRERIAAPAVWAVIAANLIWVADSLLLVLSGWVALTTLGIAFIVAQAIVVAIFAELEYVGLRRTMQSVTA